MPSRLAAPPPIAVICPECMEEFQADPLDLECHRLRCGALFHPGENPLGSDLEDEI